MEAPAWMRRLYHTAEHYLNWRWIVWGYQRLARGFSDRQLWDLSNHMARYILPRLQEFRRQMDGPKSDYFGVPAQFLEDPEQTTDEDLAQGAAAWAAALDDMIYAFEAIADEEFDSPFSVDADWGWRTFDDKPDEPFIRVETYGIHLDEEALKERNRKIKKGIEQFAEHFQSIWW